MISSPIFLPCVALVALTAIVWVRLYVERIGEMRSRCIKPQSISTSPTTACNCSCIACVSHIPVCKSAKMAISKGVIQGYTGVAAVDEKAQIIIEAQAHGTGSEQELLIPNDKKLNRENNRQLKWSDAMTEVYFKKMVSKSGRLAQNWVFLQFCWTP